MTPAILEFIGKHVPNVPQRVLEVGSLDVNGTPRALFSEAIEYVGIDLRAGKGVDRVMDGAMAGQHFGPTFDVVLSTDTLEHVDEWRAFVRGSFDALKPWGIYAITTVKTGKGYHGYPHDYWRFEPGMLDQVFKSQEILTTWLNGNAVGVVVRKISDELDLSVQPTPILEPSKAKLQRQLDLAREEQRRNKPQRAPVRTSGSRRIPSPRTK